MKRHLLIAIIALLTATVGHAASNLVVVDGVTYEWYAQNNQYGYIVTGWDEEIPIQSLHIRGEIDGYDVLGIENDAFGDNTNIEYLTIDEGITYIGDYAFSRCINLKVAILPEGLETIGEYAFEFDSSLTTMVIPSTVTEIQAHAFSYCTGVTDVYFLMDETQLEDFEGWWDGIYRNASNIGGTEFKGSRLERHNPESGTHFHVPKGMLDAYELSGEFDEWLIEEDDNCYPLWWIVNYGVVGREYTVSDDLTAVCVDVEDGLYAKDDNHWLTPDKIYSGEINFMRTTGLMNDKNNQYDQSNWVVLRNVDDPEGFKGYLINGSSITGTLVDKKNPEIYVSNETTLNKGDEAPYETNVYIPSSFMGRTQLGANDKTYAFVQPKPQELMYVDWTIYNEDDECFYLPKPDGEGINEMDLAGGFQVSYDLYEQTKLPKLEDCGVYAFYAFNRMMTSEGSRVLSVLKAEGDYTPYADGGVSDRFIVYPLELPNEPLPTGVTYIVNNSPIVNDGWYSIDGRYLGTIKPMMPGLYINGNRKVIIK
ncbi:MAG: leucine-rich repeat domain-containing protein [Muribaculaceae bacterium]|nr:leucine-rich repeat domain-containing protein [Muribaculaceae bacterium]